MELSPPTDASPLSLKLCLGGDHSVGKTSLVRRFVSDAFSELYIATLGAKVASKRYVVEDPISSGSERVVHATIWDIMGQRGFRDLFHDAFFMNAKGVLLVADATRRETLHNLIHWAESVESIAGTVPALVLLNKTDLQGPSMVTTEEVDRFCRGQGWAWIRTSAKTGEGVEEAFRQLVEMHLKTLDGVPAKPPL